MGTYTPHAASIGAAMISDLSPTPGIVYTDATGPFRLTLSQFRIIPVSTIALTKAVSSPLSSPLISAAISSAEICPSEIDQSSMP